MLRRIFTPHGIATMRNMAANGDSARDIAQRLGSTSASVRVKCSQLKIKLVRRGPWSGYIDGSGGDHPERTFMITLPLDEFCKLVEAAQLRNCSPPVLARRIVTLVLRDNLVDGVLDEDDEALEC